ncbi:hypothetical protein ZIOFF_053839 [Zingiber officinale]|uniref:Dof zinc finger protein n=1 Tax=Zingiber officinale TaxID=94328 RepID=A0A8J5FF34_ZINOF|nr:hypothetical protein ZIOFF_053839 [Zingiber officinale]
MPLSLLEEERSYEGSYAASSDWVLVNSHHLLEENPTQSRAPTVTSHAPPFVLRSSIIICPEHAPTVRAREHTRTTDSDEERLRRSNKQGDNACRRIVVVARRAVPSHIPLWPNKLPLFLPLHATVCCTLLVALAVGLMAERDPTNRHGHARTPPPSSSSLLRVCGPDVTAALQSPTFHYQQPQGGLVNQQRQERKPRPQAEQALNCPRCASTNTKFCYYNNYSLSQPRYFCKGCRRYWTQGGSLRNVPVGGGCRKNKRSSSSFSSSSKIIKSSLSSSSDLNANKAANSFNAPLPLSIPPVCNNLAMAFADNVFLLGHATGNPATATNSSFLDILTSTAASSSTGQALSSGIVPDNGGLSNLYFGEEKEGPLMSFEGGVDERALEDRVREPNSSWQGLVMNGSSSMEGIRMDMPFSALGDAYSFF